MKAMPDRAIEILGKLYRASIGELVRRMLPVVVGLAPILKEYGVLSERVWLLPWIGAFLLDKLSDLYIRGLTSDALRGRLDRANSSFAGAIDNVSRLLAHSSTRRLSEPESKSLSVSLLSRAREFAENRLGIPHSHQLRATLAVPLRDAANGKVRSVRVWCYDQPYADRLWSSLPLDGPGAPRALKRGTVEVIQDITRVQPLETNKRRKYRSVVSFPIRIGDADDDALGVLNLDSTEPNYFTERTAEELLPTIAPIASMLAVILITRAEGEAYAFDT